MKHQVASLADQIYGRLRDGIIDGRLQPGKRLVELEIAAQMGTSQGPVREALQRLERDGLVDRLARSATIVADISIGDIYELFSIRSLVESFAIRHTVERITQEQCDELQTLVESMRQASRADDMRALVEYDLEFHRRICEWSGSTTLFRTWIPLYSQIQRFIALTHKRHFPDLVELANTHQPIVEVLRRGDAEEAARIIQEHIMLIWSKIESQEILVKE
jgi:DNA-binding GntR family transcriptional regulator